MLKFSSQGSNLSLSSDPSCCSETGSLTHCATELLPNHILKQGGRYHDQTVGAAFEEAYNSPDDDEIACSRRGE